MHLQDFGETYTPISRLESIHIILAFAAHHDLKLFQMDVRSALLNGSLFETVYVKQPPGFEDPHHLTLFTRNVNNNIFICQIYVDDIKFGSTNADISEEFSRMMTKRFEMSMMGELTYFLGFQIKHLKAGIFISQTKYTINMLKKFDMDKAKPMKTPMPTTRHLDLDGDGKC